MTKAVPIKSVNAIEAAAFVISFNRAFTESETKKLLSLEKKFKEELPSFAQDMLAQVKIENNKVLQQNVHKSGVKLQHFAADGKPTWLLHVSDTQIVVNCYAYDRWDRVWAKARNYILTAAECLNLKSLSIMAVSLQYVDRFTQPKATNYSLKDVFKADSKYLTSNSFQAGNLWHVHQGWFLGDDEKRMLNVLNLGTMEQQAQVLTTIDHLSQWQFVNGLKPSKALTVAALNKDFQALHDNNKSVVGDLLNAQQLKAIGLK